MKKQSKQLSKADKELLATIVNIHHKGSDKVYTYKTITSLMVIDLIQPLCCAIAAHGPARDNHNSDSYLMVLIRLLNKLMI